MTRPLIIAALAAALAPAVATPATLAAHAPSSAHGKPTPTPTPANCGAVGEGVPCYKIGTAPQLDCPSNLECEITLVKNDSITGPGQVHTGDQDSHWRIGWGTSTDRNGAVFTHVHVVYVEPTSTAPPAYVRQPGATPPPTPTPAPTPDGRFTNLTIATDRHEYHVYLHSVAATYSKVDSSAIAFYDPIDLIPTPAPYAPPLPTPTPDPLRVELSQADCSGSHVRITGRAPFMPQQVCIGRYHYFIRVSTDAPGATITGYDAKGHERQVNWTYYDDGYYVVPTPEERIALLAGDGRSRQEVWIEFH